MTGWFWERMSVQYRQAVVPNYPRHVEATSPTVCVSTIHRAMIHRETYLSVRKSLLNNAKSFVQRIRSPQCQRAGN